MKTKDFSSAQSPDLVRSGAAQSEPRLKVVALMQLPPPVHGVTVVNQGIVNSEMVHRRFVFKVVPMRYARSIEDIDRFRAGKLFTAASIGARLVFELLRQRPDLVYFSLAPVGFSFYRDLLFIAVLKMFRVRRAFHLHGLGVRVAGGRGINNLLYRWAFAGAWIIHLAPSLYRDVEPYVPENCCLFLPNGIHDPAVAVSEHAILIRPQGVHFVYLSHMIIQKGPIVFLRALARLKRMGVAFRASFAGGRFSEECASQFHEILQEEEMSDTVQYVGPVYGSDKIDLMSQADVFVFPSLYDTFPLVVLEAMAHGLPVVAARHGAIEDIVKDGVTGFIVPPDDPLALANGLASLARDSDLCRRFGQAARQRFMENFKFEIFEKNLVEILDHCASRRPDGKSKK